MDWMFLRERGCGRDMLAERAGQGTKAPRLPGTRSETAVLVLLRTVTYIR